ncbi:TadE/TadG family type IV pilus assembly protein [Desulfovirgula thermocuniculi]|uniref:TadE/TadG family type IV pilus assembly protein n=1 Tax=Desulfovirgula thermocuniculi TaxID=348842 RepID=UPI000482C7AF|nr:pilus assembly protein TadG-related protein [Desulfovirgula thermocuniculi]
MRWQRSAGGTSRRITSDESGAVLVLMAAVCVALTLLFAGVCEFGRFLLVREQTQTAADAAALAAATSGVHRWVKIDVVTDRGEEEHCDEDSCWCSSCGTVRIAGIVGDERRLIDEDGWRDFCVPPCSCGGDDCWFEIDDRWVTYDITSGVWGTDWAQISRLEADLTEAVRQALAWKAYPYQGTVSAMLSGRNLYGIRSLLASFSDWWSAWKDVTGCGECCSECYWCGGECYESCECCNICYSEASAAYNKVSGKLGWVDRVINQINSIKWANSRGGPAAMEMFADDAAHAFFLANYPPHAESSWIWKLMVHAARNDPFYPSVTVYGRSLIASLFPGLFGVFPDSYATDVCAQGDTFYRDPATQPGRHYGSLNDVGKWVKAPPQACWQD